MQSEFPFESITEVGKTLTLFVHEKNIVIEEEYDEKGMKAITKQLKRYSKEDWRLFKGADLIGEKKDGKEKWSVWT